MSCSESSFTESDSSPPSGARRRFSTLMDTHRLASPLEVETELHLHTKQPPVKTRGASLEGAMGTIPSQGDLRSFLKDNNGLTTAGKKLSDSTMSLVTQNLYLITLLFTVGFNFADKHLRPAEAMLPLPSSAAVLGLPDPQGPRGATTDLVLRRVRHQQLSAEGEKRSPRPGTKVIKSASATTLSVVIPAGKPTGFIASAN